MSERNTKRVQNETRPDDANDEPHVEEIVPPTWGPASWWRLGVAALAVIIVVLLVIQMA